MSAQQQKDGTWRIKKKDGTLGKRRFSTKSNALAAQRGGGAKGKPKPKGKGGGGGKKLTTSSPRRRPLIGSTLQGAKATHALTAPIVEVGAGNIPRSADELQLAFRELRGKANLPYLASLAIEAGSQVLDVKFQHATALSKGSVTAWAAELYAAVITFVEARQLGFAKDKVRVANRTLSRIMRAYDPASGDLSFTDDFFIYQGLKAGGGLARRLSNRSRAVGRILNPAKRFLSGIFGARL